MAIGNQPKQNLFTAEARRRGEKQDGSPQIYAEKRRSGAIRKQKPVTAKDAEEDGRKAKPTTEARRHGEKRENLAANEREKHEWKVERSLNWLRLFFRLGILAQGELQQPVDGFGAGLKAMGKAEVVKLFQQLLFQAQVD